MIPPSRNAALLTAAASGLLVAAAFPPLDASWLAWVAWAPWLAMLASGLRLRDAVLCGAVHSVVLHAAQCFWMVHVMRVHASLSWPVALGMYGFGLVTVAPYGVAVALVVATLAKRHGSWALVAAAPASALVDVLRSHATLGHAWLIPGMTQTGHPVAMGAADVVGVHGLGAIVLLCNAALAALLLLLRRRDAPRRALPAAAVSALVLVTALAYGALARARHAPPADRWSWALRAGRTNAPHPPWPDWPAEQGGTVRAALLQGAQPQQVKVRSSPEDDLQLARVQLELNRFALDQGAQVVAWAESAHPETTMRMPEMLPAVQDQASQAQRHVVDPEVIVGALVQEPAPPGSERPYTLTNSALLVDGGGHAGRYDKRRLVPFGEYLPWRPLFGWFPQIVNLVGEMKPGESDEALAGRHGRYGAAVCYEIVLPQRLRAVVRGGADILVNLTNDGWYHGTWMPEQHLRFACMRAVESRRWVLRAANSGITAIVAPDGTIVGRMEEGERGVLMGPVQRRSVRTGYVRWGDAPIAVLGALAALWALAEALALRRAARVPVTSAP